MKQDSDTNPQWFTIKEAAKYLAIGEPTLYRWMRDGKITFRKIGDSTRFLKEDLDAFVQVFPSEKDVEKVSEICPICHHNELIGGQFRTTGLNYFVPENSKFWTLKDSYIKTNAKMCTRCGGIILFGETGKLKKLS
jgi:excisionase family DNA binding protein